MGPRRRTRSRQDSEDRWAPSNYSNCESLVWIGHEGRVSAGVSRICQILALGEGLAVAGRVLRPIAVRRSRLRFGQRKVEYEAGPNSGLGSLQRQLALIDFRKLPAGVQAQTRTRDSAECRVLGPVKWSEGPGTLQLRHSDAVVDDMHDCSIPFGDRIQFDARRTSRIGQAVIDQVVEDSTDLRTVDIDGH